MDIIIVVLIVLVIVMGVLLMKSFKYEKVEVVATPAPEKVEEIIPPLAVKQAKKRVTKAAKPAPAVKKVTTKPLRVK